MRMQALMQNDTPFNRVEMACTGGRAGQAMAAGPVFWTRPRAWAAMLIWCAACWAAIGYGIISMVG